MTPLKRNQRILLLLFCLACFLILATIFHTFFMEKILQPIALVFWLAWRVITSIHQAFYWAMVILISAFLVIRMLPRDSRSVPYVPKEQTGKITNPYLDWLASFTSAVANPRSFGELQEKMKDLSLSFISQTERMSLKKAEETVQTGPLSLSDEGRAFLLYGKVIPKGLADQFKLQVALFLGSWRKRKVSKLPSILLQTLDEILSFMESKAETDHDHEIIE